MITYISNKYKFRNKKILFDANRHTPTQGYTPTYPHACTSEHEHTRSMHLSRLHLIDDRSFVMNVMNVLPEMWMASVADGVHNAFHICH